LRFAIWSFIRESQFFFKTKMRCREKIFIIVLVLICFQAADGGWVRQNSGTLAWLRTGFFVNEKRGWIGGANGTLLTTEDGGATWKKAEKPTSDSIRQIYFSDERTGWLLCERDPYSLGANDPSYLLKTQNGGLDWEKIEFSGAGRLRITKIFFSTGGLGVAVGEQGAVFILQDDERTWKRQPSVTRYLLLTGAFTDKRNGVIAGAGGTIFFTDDAGISWNPANVPGAAGVRFGAVFFAGKSAGWAVGAGGKIFQTVSGGRSWREQKSGTTADLNDIFFKDTAEGWAAGNEGTILHTKTGGNVWTPVDVKTQHKLEKLIYNGKSVFAVGFGGTILRYDETGRE
jgi:photosystem II stability/assembly factor-like uncharacterized protein